MTMNKNEVLRRKCSIKRNDGYLLILFIGFGYYAACCSAFSRSGGRIPIVVPPISRGASHYIQQQRMRKPQIFGRSRDSSTGPSSTSRGAGTSTGTGSISLTKMYMSSSTADENDVEDSVDHVPLKEDEDFIAAVSEVKQAAKNVTASSVQLTSAIVKKGPGIFWRLFTTLVSKELR